MFLYTIVPIEYIFGEMEDDGDYSQEKFHEVEIKKGQTSIMCQSLPSGEMRVNRIISTNPQDYLKTDWQPGSIVSK